MVGVKGGRRDQNGPNIARNDVQHTQNMDVIYLLDVTSMRPGLFSKTNIRENPCLDGTFQYLSSYFKLLLLHPIVGLSGGVWDVTRRWSIHGLLLISEHLVEQATI